MVQMINNVTGNSVSGAEWEGMLNRAGNKRKLLIL